MPSSGVIAFSIALLGFAGCEAVRSSSTTAPAHAGQEGTSLPTTLPTTVPTTVPTVTPSPSPSAPPIARKRVRVSWAASREAAVNSSGGGYRVYYSRQPAVEIASASVINVPYVSGPAAPTSVRIEGLDPGMLYVRVVSYTSWGDGAQSASSTPISINVPGGL